MGTQSIAPISGTYSLLDIGAIPGFLSDVPDSGYQWAEAFLDPRMMEIWDEYTRPDGFKIIAGSISDSNNIIWADRAITTLDDFKGVKVRASGKTQTAALAALGASPVTLSMAEVEEALVRGTVDAITSSKSYGSRRGLIKICDYANVWPVTPVFAGIFAINVDVWDDLDPYLQEGLLKASQQMTREAAAAVEQAHIDYTLWIGSSECELVTPDPNEVKMGMDLMGPVVEEWIGFSGPLAKDVLSIASEYATGPAVDLVKGIVGK
jgi:TRAP-type C4-dicarboxylate transport system substrate-binding protein